MAERAADYLQRNPKRRMVVLAGSGHLMYGQGIPKRLLRRQPVSSAVIINSGQYGMEPGLADFLLFPERIDLPRSGLLGILLDLDGDGVAVKGFSDDSPAEQAGLEKGDRVVRIAGQPIASYTDIRFSLMDHPPGGGGTGGGAAREPDPGCRAVEVSGEVVLTAGGLMLFDSDPVGMLAVWRPGMIEISRFGSLSVGEKSICTRLN